MSRLLNLQVSSQAGGASAAASCHRDTGGGQPVAEMLPVQGRGLPRRSSAFGSCSRIREARGSPGHWASWQGACCRVGQHWGLRSGCSGPWGLGSPRRAGAGAGLDGPGALGMGQLAQASRRRRPGRVLTARVVVPVTPEEEQAENNGVAKKGGQGGGAGQRRGRGAGQARRPLRGGGAEGGGGGGGGGGGALPSPARESSGSQHTGDFSPGSGAEGLSSPLGKGPRGSRARRPKVTFAEKQQLREFEREEEVEGKGGRGGGGLGVHRWRQTGIWRSGGTRTRTRGGACLLLELAEGRGRDWEGDRERRGELLRGESGTSMGTVTEMGTGMGTGGARRRTWEGPGQGRGKGQGQRQRQGEAEGEGAGRGRQGAGWGQAQGQGEVERRRDRLGQRQ